MLIFAKLRERIWSPWFIRLRAVPTIKDTFMALFITPFEIAISQ